jgi:DinB superfamily
MRSTIFLMVLLPTVGWAQNPVSDAIREALTSRAKNTIAAAEEMPAEKYNFKPTAAQQPFEHWVSHGTQANYFLCSKLTDATPPEAGVKEGDPKDKLVAALKQSFDYCSAQLPKLQDSQLGAEVALFRNRKTTKGAAVVELSADWADHYAQMATYLRLNGLLPPTAKK